jgi:hypothetical protein
MNIYIVSSGRPNRQITLDNLRDLSNYPVHLVVPEKERKAYIEANPTHGSWIFHDKFGIKDTRQFVLNYAINSGQTKFIMLDDDLTFYGRTPENKFVKCQEFETKILFSQIFEKLNDYAHGSVCDKFMSQMQPRDCIYNSRYNQIMCYNLDLFPNPIPKFRMEVGEEQDFNLQLLSKGKQSFIFTEWAKSSTPYSSGGCSEWRTAEVERTAHQGLVDQWPGIVSLKPNKNTISKTSLSIKWKKAYVADSNLHSVKV